MYCLLINYDGGSLPLLSQYIRRSGCQELTLTTGQADYPAEAEWWQTCHLIFLHLTYPGEIIRDELAVQLRNHPGVIITSPFPKHQFPNLAVQPFAFLTEPFSFTRFADCITAYRQQVYRETE